MSNTKTIFFAVAAMCLFSGSDWRQFRGTDNTSTSPERKLPATFDGEHNVAWKAPLPGRGASGPIVVGDRVVVTCSSGVREDRLYVVCIDAKTGKHLWQRQLWATGHTLIHPMAANAAPTPASDGQRVFAFYSSNDLACFDLDGNLQWFRGLAHESPNTRNDAGMASSPLVIGDTVIVQLENQGESFAAGIDAATGETRWRIARGRDAIWSSPVVLRGKTPAEDIFMLHGRTRLSGHNPRTGATLWEHEGMMETVSSTTTCGNIIYLPAVGLHALQYDTAKRTVEPLWYEQRLRTGTSSPVVCGGRVYALNSSGVLTCGNAADGKTLWQERLKGPFWATPVMADGRLYCVNHDGLVQIVQPGDERRVVVTTQIDAGMLASPAVADGAIYFRSDGWLWKVAAGEGATR